MERKEAVQATDEQIKGFLVGYEELYNELTAGEKLELGYMLPKLNSTANYTRSIDRIFDEAVRGDRDSVETLERMVDKFIKGVMPEGKEDAIDSDLLFRIQVMRQGALIDTLTLNSSLQQFLENINNRLREKHIRGDDIKLS